jgi:hypothetical protein
MRFLLGWAFKLGLLGMAWLAMTGSLQFKLSDALISDLAGKTQSSLSSLADRLR